MRARKAVLASMVLAAGIAIPALYLGQHAEPVPQARISVLGYTNEGDRIVTEVMIANAGISYKDALCNVSMGVHLDTVLKLVG